jgi:integrase
MHLTAKAVADLPLTGTPAARARPEYLDKRGRSKAQAIFFDTKQPGFGVIVGRRRKTYFYQREVNGRTVRVNLGDAREIKIVEARELAHEKAKEMRGGRNPNAKTETLRQAIDKYVEAIKERGLSDRTVHVYGKAARHLADWLDKDLAEISRAMVYDRHRKIGKEHGRYAANGAMRTFRAVYNRAMRRHERLGVCPTIAVEWFAEDRRKAAIADEDLRSWYAEAQAMGNEVHRDYLLFCLFTGMRREAAAAVEWSHVDLDKATLHVPKPKGGEKRAFDLPLSDFLVELLQRRREGNEVLHPGSPWAFPANSESGHIAEPRGRFKVVPFILHGLRDTYVTAAHRTGVKTEDIKLLVNHALPKGDVTTGYISFRDALEHLRPIQQSITDRLRRLIDPEGGEVVKLVRKTV